jgi:CSLREA domain-containing protein
VESLEDRAAPATFTVNTTLDEVVASDGKLSLREAITRANTTTGADEIIVPVRTLAG